MRNKRKLIILLFAVAFTTGPFAQSSRAVACHNAVTLLHL
jgi:hypothetical protein